MSHRLHIEHPPGYVQERSYIYTVLFSEFLGIDIRMTCADRQNVRIRRAEAADDRDLVFADVLFQTPPDDWLTTRSLPQVRGIDDWRPDALLPDGHNLPDRIPALYRDPTLVDVTTDRTITSSLDIFGGAFFMLSRYEELVILERDQHGRFTSGQSATGLTGILDRPLVNEYLEVLWSCLIRLWPDLQRKQRTHMVSLSHDVDWPLCTAGRPARKAARTIAGDILTRRSASLALRRSVSVARTLRGRPDADLCNTFDFIMDMNEQYGFATAFYFIAEQSAGEIDGCYSLDDPWIRNLMTRIHERGHEVGLHPSYETFRDPVQTQYEFDRLRAAADCLGIRQERWGGRQHFLRWECPTTWRIWNDAGLDYDSTLGYSDQAGFRCGVCYDFPVFDLETRSQMSLREHPLIAMEVTLNGYMGLSWDEAANTILKLNDTCRRYSGEFTLLWHNNVLVTDVEKRTYTSVIEGLAS